MSKQTLKKQVLRVLEIDKYSRNSDIRLTQCIWKGFYSEYIKKDKNEVAYIRLEDLIKLPREDNIKRIRAKIQNEEHLFVPTDEKVALKGGFDNVQEWRSFLGYPSGDTL